MVHTVPVAWFCVVPRTLVWAQPEGDSQGYSGKRNTAQASGAKTEPSVKFVPTGRCYIASPALKRICRLLTSINMALAIPKTHTHKP